MSKEAMKLMDALLVKYSDVLYDQSPHLAAQFENAIAALREALAEQPAQQQSCYCPNCEALARELVELKAQPAQRTDDTKRLDALAENSWDLRCFDMPTGADDADIGWRVIEHHMAKPYERTVAEVFRDDPRQAIDEAIKAATKTKDTP